MKNLNESLLESLDLIQESQLESEISVLASIGDQYMKINMLMEYADEDVVDEFSIVQESFIMEADETKKDDKKEDKVPFKEKVANSKIVRFFKWIGKMFGKLLSWIGKKIKKIGDKISYALGVKKIKDANGEVYTKKQIKNLKENLNETMRQTMAELKNESSFADANQLYAMTKGNVFKFDGGDLLINIPFFEAIIDQMTKVIKTGELTEKNSQFMFKKYTTFEFVKYEEAADRIEKSSEKIRNFFDEKAVSLVANNTKIENPDKFLQRIGSIGTLLNSDSTKMVHQYFEIIEDVVNEVTASKPEAADDKEEKKEEPAEDKK